MNARYPMLRLAALGFTFVVAIQALQGLRWGVVAAVVFALGFSFAEYVNGPVDQMQFALPNAIARLFVALVVVGLTEAIRAQSRALDESRLRERTLELQHARHELSASDARFQLVGESIPFGVWSCDAGGRVVYMSPSFLKLVGMTLDEVRDGGWLRCVAPEDGTRIREAWRDRLQWPELWEDEYRLTTADGKSYTILCRGRCVRDDQGQILGWTGINLDITQRSRARDQLNFLVELGRMLSMSLDPATTLERFSDLMVPRIADWCSLEIVPDSGDLQLVSVRHGDPAKADLLRRLRAYPRSEQARKTIDDVLRTGASVVYPQITDEMLVATAQDAQHLALLRSAGITSSVIVPMRARERVLGVMTLANSESGRTFTQDDVHFIEIICARATLAYDNARSYAKEQQVADTFQRASLPTTLPQLPGISLHAVYLPGATESEVGGDWYDAFQLPDGRLAFSIGDVAGKGLRAAVAMASTRPALRGCALEGLSPAEVLRRVNQRISYDGGGMVTAVAGVLDPVALTLTVASAGHPAPLIGHIDGTVDRVAVRGLPLGLFSDHEYEEVTVQLTPGSLVVLYTDGLIEFDHNIFEGERLLIEAIQGEIEMKTPDPPAALARRVILGAPQDDVAVLTIRIDRLPLDAVELTTTASPANARVIRQALRRFVMGLPVERDQLSDLLTATGEAVSNVIEHAYGIDGGPVSVRAYLDNGDLVVRVADQGVWRSRNKQDGSGRGLIIMRALMKSVDVGRDGQGTTVTMRMPLTENVGERAGNVSTPR
ncbi:MAG: SpoIIE family protein phosphatase [Candidatus Eremiobacteraeota bacterium]|nr:SpoIIE family protein phosphatase [Candidatus Eremiobacteraeota bacterium]